MIFGRLWEEKDEETLENSTNIHDSRSVGFKKATRDLREATIIEEIK
jgi:hypothetical protein